MTGRRPARGAAVAVAALALVSVGAGAAAPASAAAPTPVGVHVTGRTSLVEVRSATVLVDRGTVRGGPVGSGRISLVYTLWPREAIATTTFTIVNRRGTISGRMRSTYAVGRLSITFTGAGRITGGTGAYAGIRSGPLRFAALHSITGRREVLELTGRATFPG